MLRTIASRSSLEDEWRERVSAASFAYELARLDSAAALKRCTGPDVTPCEIESFKFAKTRETNALNEYTRVLRIFHELVVEGVMPPV